MAESEENWVDKYQPKTLSEVKGQDPIIHRLQTKVRIGHLSHLLFIGPPGVGKTATAQALAKDLFGKNWRLNFSKRNASDDRGIDFVRHWVKDQTFLQPIEAPFRIVFLDEIDSMTSDSQFAMREVIMANTATCKFVASCNYPEKLIEPLQDRCQIFRFRRLDDLTIKLQVEKIASGEKIPLTHTQAMKIAVLSDGSMRKAINALDSLYGETEVTDVMIDSLLPVLNPEHSKTLMKLAMSGNLEETEKFLYQLYYNKGFSVREILNGMASAMWKSEIPLDKKCQLTYLIGKYDSNLSTCGSQLIQLRCLLYELGGIKYE